MDAASYEKISAPFRGADSRVSMLRIVDKVLEALFYAAYALLIIIVAVNALGTGMPLWQDSLLVSSLAVPFVGFVFVTILRKLVNAPRPYEALDIDPLIKKDTVGQSFPSKHTFSSFIIALCWMRVSFAAGIVLLVAALAIAGIRVIGGVHFPRDVIGAALCAFAFGGLLLPW